MTLQHKNKQGFGRLETDRVAIYNKEKSSKVKKQYKSTVWEHNSVGIACIKI